MESNEVRIIPQGATVLTETGFTGTVTAASWTALNGKSYTQIWLTGVAKNASRRILTAKLTVLDLN